MTPDEVGREGGGAVGPPRPRTTGPRHAAPRKPLLTRLHLPAGKAMALAAMPTAVLMGMGLTPQLATAKPLPKNPFKDGPCVSAPDREPEEDDRAPEPGGDEDENGRETPGRSPDPDTTGAPEPGVSLPADPGLPDPELPEPNSDPRSGSGADDGDGDGDGEERQDAGAERPAPGPSESEPNNPLDPLGVGDALRDLLTPPQETEEPEETPDEEPGAAPSASASPSPSPSAGREATDPVGDAAEGIERGLRDTTDAAGDRAGEVADGAEDLLEDVTGTAGEPAQREAAQSEAAEKEAAEQKDQKDQKDQKEEATPEPDASGKEPYPCPRYDAEALADAEGELTEALLPDAPWRLESTLLALHGLEYHGIVKVRTYNGTVKDVLKFTASSVDIRDLHQIVEGPGGTEGHVEARAGSTSTIRNGTVTMYTERLKGNLFGLIPVTFSPQSPPPLNVPEAFFTDVTVIQAGQFGGTLHIPGMNLYNQG